MKKEHGSFDESHVLHQLKHYLPAQAPLKDFIHHNTLHAFQHLDFFEACRLANSSFGYKTSLSLKEYRQLFAEGKIKEDVLRQTIQRRKGEEHIDSWMQKMLKKEDLHPALPKIGSIRHHWKKHYRIDLDSLVFPILFRTICSYLDQGISIWNFPVHHKGFLSSLREMEKSSFVSLFKTERARKLLIESNCSIQFLLEILVGKEELFEDYLYDQQFAHQGWSGMVSSVEDNPNGLLDHKHISLHDFIIFELLLEIDALDEHFGDIWAPLGSRLQGPHEPLLQAIPETEYHKVLRLWQEAYEWSFYDEVLSGIQGNIVSAETKSKKSFQALFCIDDRECSIRRHLEAIDPDCETFGTPGFFNVEFYFKPEHGKFYDKVCPAPVTPKFLIKEIGGKGQGEKDANFHRQTNSLFFGWLISQTLGPWSAFKLFLNIFKPRMSPATASSFKHMDHGSELHIESSHPPQFEKGLQIGFGIDDMVIRVEGLLRNIGLLSNFAQIVYVVGHGSSSVNNPYYAAYDCGACSGRPGSVNARVFCFMANHKEVRLRLKERGIHIPDETIFIGALHDTASDEVAFYDEKNFNEMQKLQHSANGLTFKKALDFNAKERSRRLVTTNSYGKPEQVHDRIKKRVVSLFEPRPELNHATNALCIIGKRDLTRSLFLDRRAFMNSYDAATDPDGTYLLNILKPAAPVCGGINLEYYFSRTDNQKLGAGTKLPHNVMGLFGLANGADGDLRPGLPVQMIEVHDPLRLLMIVEHKPEIILSCLAQSPETYEWFKNDWIKLVAVHPENRNIYVFEKGEFAHYHALQNSIPTQTLSDKLFEAEISNLPVFKIKEEIAC
ncbi:MAG: YbcC family protein [Bacteroidia bacterium]